MLLSCPDSLSGLFFALLGVYLFFASSAINLHFFLGVFLHFITGADNHKCMETIGFLPKPPLSMSAAQPAADSAAQPLLRETREIWINGTPVTVYVDEIEKQITQGLYAHLGLQFGA